MDWAHVITIAGGITSGVGALCLLLALYFYSVNRTEERSVRDLIGCTGLSEQETHTLQDFKDDQARLEALRAMLQAKGDVEGRLFKKVKANIDVERIARHHDTHKLKRIRTIGILSLAFGIILLLIGLVNPKFFRSSSVGHNPTNNVGTVGQHAINPIPQMVHSATNSIPPTVQPPTSSLPQSVSALPTNQTLLQLGRAETPATNTPEAFGKIATIERLSAEEIVLVLRKLKEGLEFAKKPKREDEISVTLSNALEVIQGGTGLTLAYWRYGHAVGDSDYFKTTRYSFNLKDLQPEAQIDRNTGSGTHRLTLRCRGRGLCIRTDVTTQNSFSPRDKVESNDRVSRVSLFFDDIDKAMEMQKALPRLIVTFSEPEE